MRLNSRHLAIICMFYIENKLLCELLGRDQLLIRREISVWVAALRWADEHCCRNAKECSAANRRAALGPALYKIRFPLIPHEKIYAKIAPTGVLSSDELVSVLLYHSHPSHTLPAHYPLQFSIQQRHIPEDMFNYNGTIRLQFGFFGRASSEFVYIRGISWRITAMPFMKPGNRRWLSLFLNCEGQGDDENDDDSWSCTCSATFRIDSEKKGVDAFTRKVNMHVFNAKSKSLGWNDFVSFKDLMKLDNERKNTVTLAVDVTVGYC
ncbi:hypothetical protein niasHT_031088 [Heterodera trifolii]